MKGGKVKVIDGQRYLVFKNKKKAKKAGVYNASSDSCKPKKHKKASKSDFDGTLSTANSVVTLVSNTVSLGKMFLK